MSNLPKESGSVILPLYVRTTPAAETTAEAAVVNAAAEAGVAVRAGGREGGGVCYHHQERTGALVYNPPPVEEDLEDPGGASAPGNAADAYRNGDGSAHRRWANVHNQPIVSIE